MKVVELVPTNGRKSFGSKAKMITVDDVTTLISYETEVASYNHKTNVMTVNGYYSPTTASHINAFLEYFGFDQCTKKQLKEYYAIKD